MLSVIRKARRRLLINELFSQAANAFSAALLAFILLLLAGTELLRWQWLLLLPAAAAAIGIVLAVRRLPSLYATARIVDRRLGLADSLSTAWFFQYGRASSGSDEMIRGQGEQAARMAETADVRAAVPFRVPRTAYAMAVLALVASSLFALRYGITRTLDLHPPLARILEQQFGIQPKTVLAKNVRHDPPPPNEQSDAGDNDVASQEPNQSGDPEEAPQQNSENEANRSGEKKGPGNRGDTQKQTQEADQQSATDEQNEGDQQQSPSDSRSQNPGQQASQKSDQGKQSGAQRDPNGSNESSSLLTKVKDAVQNLLSRVKPQQSSQGSQQASEQNAKQQQGKGQQNGGKQQSKNGERGDNGQKGDSQEGEGGERAENSPDPQGKSSGKSEGQENSKQPGSGIGSQDGDKSIKQAEQLAAMGKISEIIGKRSATITGEATVDVQSTSQQLRTPYAQRGAQHAQGGAEIDRDEIPVALQGYIEKYFEQVRKQAPKK